MKRKIEILWKVWTAVLLLGLFGCAIMWKAASVQIIEGAELRKLTDSLTIYYKTIEPERGNIYSENGDLLSTSLPFFEVRMDFRSDAMTDSIFNSKVDSLALMMAQEIGKKTYHAYRAELIKNRQKGNRYYLVKRNVKYPELKAMKKWAFFNLGRYKSGMIVLQKNKRKNPFGMLAHRTIGYVRDDGKVKVGIEGKFDDYLKGVQGKILVQKIAGGNYIPLNEDDDVQAQTGQDVYLTIDVNMQDLAESALVKALRKHRADHGSVVIMEVATGKIKAIANLGYVENMDRYMEDYNYVVGEATEPGSTFKLMSLAALIDDGYVSSSTIVNLENGEKQYADRIMKDSHKPEKNDVDVKMAFATSSNVGVSKLVQKYYGNKYKKFYNKLQAMEVDNLVGVEIDGEASPVIHDPKDWSLVSLPWMSIGYEIQLTPLQTLRFYNAVANGGKMMKPYLVSSIKEYNKTIEEFKPMVVNSQVLSKNTIAELQEMLEAVVEKGTVGKHKSKNIRLAGKTGTSIIANKKTNYSDKVYQASFAGYFPADAPKYSCIVVVNNPRVNGFYGGGVAAPVFVEIADKIYAKDLQLGKVLAEKPIEINERMPLVGNVKSKDAQVIYNTIGYSYHSKNNEEYGVVKTKDKSLSLKVNPMIDNLMPNVVGMDLRDAFYVLENAGLRIRYTGKGKVKKQSIKAGKKYQKGNIVALELELK